MYNLEYIRVKNASDYYRKLISGVIVGLILAVVKAGDCRALELAV